MNTFKRILASGLALVLLLGCLTGCGSKSDNSILSPKAPTEGRAMGRYVEQAIEIPDLFYAEDMVMLSDGRLRVSGSTEDEETHVWTMTDSGDWEETPLPAEIDESGYVASVALAADGRIFCYTTVWGEGFDKNEDHHLWLVEADGQLREIPITYPDMDSVQGALIHESDFTQSGKLMAVVNYRELRELNLETGAMSENLNDMGIYPYYLCCVMEDTYLVGGDGGFVYSGGEITPLSGVPGDQILATVAEYTGSGRISLWGNAEGYLFFVTRGGLYSAVPGGSVTELLVDGKRTSLGGPAFSPIALTGDEDGSFYVLGSDGGEAVLYRYYYDENVPTEPDKTLRIYSLRSDETLQQAASLFQKNNPDYAVDLEIGVTGEDGVTEADAIKALNTRILAGTGPDILNLDGLPLESFLEKGILTDLSGVISRCGDLLTNVTNCYERDGKVCAMPTGFTLPAIYGPEDIVSGIHDMDSLVEAVIASKERNPKGSNALYAVNPVEMADNLYDSCSAAWKRSDGTLDEEKLTEYYRGMKTLYDLDGDYRASLGDEIARFSEWDYAPGYMTYLGAAYMVCRGTGCNVGMLCGMDWWESALMGDQKLTGYEVLPLNVQSSNTFLPKRVVGILNTSENKTAAEDFLVFLLGEQVQTREYAVGFPVNMAALDKQIAEDKESYSSGSFSNDDGTYEEYDGLYPDAQRRQRLRGWAEALTTPALTDQTVRNAVIEQAKNCLNGNITPEEAAKAAIRSLNLYLSE